MSDSSNAMEARESARSEESQPAPIPGASLGADEPPALSQPEQQAIPRTALERNILAVSQLIERYPERIARAKQRKEFGDATALEKERENLTARKAALERLRDSEERKRV